MFGPIGGIPEFDENGELVSLTEVTPGGILEIPIREMKNYEKEYDDFFRDRPNGTTITYRNAVSDVLEITKIGENLYDAIHHFHQGGQEAVRKISCPFAVCEIFMGQYDTDSRVEIDAYIFDNSKKTETTAVANVDENSRGEKQIHLHLEQQSPEGDVQVCDRVQVIHDRNNIDEFHPAEKGRS